jgi:hypothetical protein
MPHPPIHQQVTFLYTRDLAATARFYEEMLDLRLALDQGDWSHLPRQPRQVSGLLPTRGRVRGVVWGDLDPRRSGGGQGVTFGKPLTLNPKCNIYHYFLRDSDGYLMVRSSVFSTQHGQTVTRGW